MVKKLSKKSVPEYNSQTLGIYRYAFDVKETEGVYTYCVIDYEFMPSKEMFKKDVNKFYNSECDNKILSGYTFDGAQVWMSIENQLNYKAAYDLSVQSQGASLPITIKLGTDEEPVYHEFASLTDISNFYLGAVKWVQDCTAECWEKKDSIDYSVYDLAD